jgi:hypothetical protein
MRAASVVFGGSVPVSIPPGIPLSSVWVQSPKVGNPSIRVLLVEMAWRLVKFQPQYQPIQKWHQALSGTNKALKKKAIVAVARRLLIDIWRIRTGRTTAQEVGLVLSD